MAKMGVEDPGGSSGKKGFSSRLLQMKFMQRKQEKRKAEEAVEQAAEPEGEDAQWVAEGTRKGCIIICEPDPPPGALLGHMAFGGFNPDTEKLQKEAEERLQAVKAGKSDNPVVSDDEMARRMGQKEDPVSSMRMQKKKKNERDSMLRAGIVLMCLA